MRIIFTNHARQRMQERGISESEVVESIQYPANILRENGGIQHFQKSFTYGTIEVVVGVKKNHFIVITVYPL